ncbi:hypothetical protein NPX13_g6674 [Xylaria arbuscula]|uniref:Uncharacterized protein n=1 Tax=Xylaria arbuscula TaxID=114810 RepID=A0A9W8NC60_9PEZI|nr:hypothetical protein NPX13_g6674 [Xylaria arbuscula]
MPDSPGPHTGHLSLPQLGRPRARDPSQDHQPAVCSHDAAPRPETKKQLGRSFLDRPGLPERLLEGLCSSPYASTGGKSEPVPAFILSCSSLALAVACFALGSAESHRIAFPAQFTFSNTGLHNKNLAQVDHTPVASAERIRTRRDLSSSESQEGMATDFIMPRLADAQPSHYFQHQPESHAYATAQLPDHAPRQVAQGYQSRQVSPLSSNNGSPTSPKPYHRQRLRPLYMPAVLRPNEHPYKGCHGTKNEGEPQTPGAEDDRPLSSANSFITLPGLSGWSRLGRQTTCDTEGSTESEWDLDLFPKPTAPPSRLHWKVCFDHMLYLTRVLASHSPTRKPRFAMSPRVCASSTTGQGGTIAGDVEISSAIYILHLESRLTKMQTTIPEGLQASSDDSSVKQVSQTAPSSPVITTPIGANPQAPPHPAEVAMSVPRDWHWSTF